MTHKRVEHAEETVKADLRAEVEPLWGLDLSPVVNAEEGSAALPIGFIYLASWAKDAEFLEEFLKTFVHRSLIDFILRKHMFSDTYVDINSCSLRGFRNVYEDEPETAASEREMQISVLTEAAVQGMIFRNVDRSTNVAVQLGSDYFYERDLIYVSYSQTWCQLSEYGAPGMGPGFVPPELLIDQTMRRDYRSSNWFYRCQRPSCFFWAQGEASEGEGAT
ncbi:hypothetical protein PoB_007010000 [Plakobranchus ocellatus]|uniref:Uncharacterized protein n=1 Tax=Plakobranchus ocellatus TaxID=259542 RepID=A0AAV4DI07_9GAST|nr:hypothetical protein PoB_007010000 [Plakobranchus ocellatus]